MIGYDNIDFELLHSVLLLLCGFFIVTGFLYMLRLLTQGARGDYPGNPLKIKSSRISAIGSIFLVLSWFAYRFSNPWVIAAQLALFLGFYVLLAAMYAKQKDEDAVLVIHGIACGLIFFAGFGLGLAVLIFIVLALLTRMAFWLWLSTEAVIKNSYTSPPGGISSNGDES